VDKVWINYLSYWKI